MKRDASDDVQHWLERRRRLPLVIRGARQVGKTWLVRDAARRGGLGLVELNFERDPSLARCFASNDPQRVLGELSLALERDVRPDGTLLFLDEIQAASEVLAALRWFAEEMPDLPIIAAGSLLEFTLASHSFSMPVGRVTYLHIEPMTFREYLQAHSQDRLLRVLEDWRRPGDLSATAHAKATEWFDRYSMVGGMPAAVSADVAGAEPGELRRIQHDLIATYRDDFAKYARHTDPTVLDAVTQSVAAQLGKRFVYSHVSDGIRHDRARRALELLARARVCQIVQQTSANGIPLGGQVRGRSRKVILLDVGLAHALLGTPAAQAFPRRIDLAPALRGALAEQLLGQQLRTLRQPWEEARLYYWQRGGGCAGEIDFVLQVDTRVIAVECKSGAAGAMKSLHQFMYDRALDIAVRLDANPPSVQDLDVTTTQQDRARYRLISLPHYLGWRIADVVRELGSGAAPARDRG